jgi:hypothetical protein
MINFGVKDLSDNSDSIKISTVNPDSKIDLRIAYDQPGKKICNKIYFIHNYNFKKFCYCRSIYADFCRILLAWGHSCNLSKSFLVQRKCIRIITYLLYHDHCGENFNHLEIITISYIHHTSIYFSKCNHDHEYMYNTINEDLYHLKIEKSSHIQSKLRDYCSAILNHIKIYVLTISEF